jgi:pimeloyl-ACP methyl ester carboxylesterase
MWLHSVSLVEPQSTAKSLRPTLLFWGLESFAPVPENDPRVTAMQHCRLIKVPKAGHWMHHDHLELFLKETTEFLAR